MPTGSITEVLPDIQATKDTRGLPIDRVGVTGLSYPITVLTKAGSPQVTIGEISLAVGLPHDVRGTHMSRFIEILENHRGEMTVRTLPALLDDCRQRLNAESAEVQMSFPYFVEREAPVSGKSALMDYRCRLEGRQGIEGAAFTLGVTVPIATLCPCSREISDYGAHNQRGYVEVAVHSPDFSDDRFIWIEEIIDWVEASASAPLFPLLKRSDERYVTMQAYENPRFVEDVVREVGLRLSTDPRIEQFRVRAENLESIHNHSAFAEVDWTRGG